MSKLTKLQRDGLVSLQRGRASLKRSVGNTLAERGLATIITTNDKEKTIVCEITTHGRRALRDA